MRDVPTLAGLLAFHGYETTAFCASPMVTAKTGMTRGFQHVEEFWKPNLIRLSLSGCRTFQRLCPTNRDKGGADLVARAVEWLRSRDSSLPYFMFVNLFEAHAPYQAVPERFRRAFVAPGVSLRQLEIVGTRGYLAQWSGDEFPRRYDQHLTDLLDGAISAADSSLSQLADAAGDDVVLIVLSDHGDLIGEHDYHGHGHVLWEPLIRIPLVLAGPGIPSGAVVDEPVSIIDVMPTILEMADIPTDHLTGTDLRRVLTNDGETGRILYAQQFCNTPDDVVQDAFLRLMGQKNRPDQVAAWLFRVVRNGAISASRAAARRTRHESAAAHRGEPWFAVACGERLDATAAADALRTLPVVLRESIVAASETSRSTCPKVFGRDVPRTLRTSCTSGVTIRAVPSSSIAMEP